MIRRGAIVGVSDHCGWAVLLTVTGKILLDHRRVELVDPGLPWLPYHCEGQKMGMEDAVALVERVRLSAERNARRVLDELEQAIDARVLGIALRECAVLKPTVEERLLDYFCQNNADGVMYRQALALAAEERGWEVHWFKAKGIFERARLVMGVEDIEAFFGKLKAKLGSPWNADHKLALAAALAARAC